jgi:hypothetical protein
MITKKQNSACLIVGEKALQNPEWKDYGDYCLNREKGLRKQAFSHLESFLCQAVTWSFEKKLEFVQWLCDLMDTVADASYGPYPTPLSQRLFIPLFEEWIKKEPNNAEVFALKAQYTVDFESYKIAVRIDPENQRARLALARQCAYDIWYSTHHLPEYFIGNEKDILSIVAEGKGHIAHLHNGIRKDDIFADILNEEQLLQDWIEFNLEGGEDFNIWCTNKERHYKWIKAYYYDA